MKRIMPKKNQSSLSTVEKDGLLKEKELLKFAQSLKEEAVKTKADSNIMDNYKNLCIVM